MKTTTKKCLARVFAVVFVLCFLACCIPPMNVLAANEAVNDARNGVLQVNLDYRDDDNTTHHLAGGSGFLINDNTLVTCHHVVSLDDNTLAAFAELEGKSVAEIRDRLSISVTISRDVVIPATVQHESFDMDWAVLSLSRSIQGRTALKIRSSADVKQTESVYAIGFPSISTLLQTYSTFTSDDATVTSGVVNKVAIGENLHSGANTEFIMTSCNLDSGCSGGPMVDEDGNVVGIAQGIWQMSEEDGEIHPEFFNAVAIDQVTEVLDAMGIVYEKAGAAEPEPVVEEPVVEEPVVEEPAVEEPVVEAPVAEPVVEEPAAETPVVDVPAPAESAAPEKESGLSTTTIILIVAAVAVVVVIVVVVVVLSKGKKKPNPAPVGGGYVPPAPPVRPGGFSTPNPTPAPFTTPTADAGETTVLSQGAGETTVLSRQVNGGTLTRKRTGETVSVNTENFVIGRERKSTNYCIADNSSISRTHVKLTVRGGITYLTDMNAANGTFVNGVKVMPRQEVALKNGDTITLADEDLIYKN